MDETMCYLQSALEEASLVRLRPLQLRVGVVAIAHEHHNMLFVIESEEKGKCDAQRSTK